MQPARHTHARQLHTLLKRSVVWHAASRGYSFVVWLRLDSTKAGGAAGGRALFTLKGSTSEGPKGVAAALKGALRCSCKVLLGTACSSPLRVGLCITHSART